ncbi:ricin B lectin domain-containing protein [Crepidotus variabilis]|uniref:Ricin B lectin domain-containing protein n=1 Tax=Crepidotus variabilis TaxID=179855 RepID=A0A9P6JKY2_9AGAR|nr:ricin B lectin domain-containing protein [Crepidotus variabilis]
MKTTSQLALLASFLTVASAQTYNIINKCPEEFSIFWNGRAQYTMAANDKRTLVSGPNTGFVYTNYNGGKPNGDNTTRFATLVRDNSSYFFVVKGNKFNTGISVTPSGGNSTTQGFCPAIVCDSPDCNTAFDVAPVAPAGFPPVGSSAPTPPLYSCPGDNVSYDVTFCPNDKFPNEITGVPIHPKGHEDKCWDVRGAVFENGTPVQVYDCNGSQAQKWVIDLGTTKVRVAGTNFCLDRGETPGNGVGMKIWQCYQNQPPQAWVFNDVGTVAASGLCVDVPSGDVTNTNQLQTWECGAENNNQLFTI